MLIKKNDIGTIITESLYDSSNIIASRYNKVSGDLIVIFKGGRQYEYKGVKSSDYMRFETADSQGSAINAYLKKYNPINIGITDVETLIVEINSYLPKELDEQGKELVTAFKTFIDNHDGKGEIDKEELRKIKELIEVILTIKEEEK